jgi:hypothetical protein
VKKAQQPKRLEIPFSKTGLLAAILLIFVSVKCYSQGNELELSERSNLELCGKTIYLDAVWMNDGFMTADISILDQPNSKPITGGYRKGDELVISRDEGCTFYVFSVSKSGLDGAEGKVILSKSPPVSPVQICEDSLIWKEGGNYMVDSVDWEISSIKKNSEGKIMAHIKESYSAKNLRKFTMKKNYMVWLGECLFQVSSLSSETAVHMGNKWEIEEGRIVLVKVTSYFYTPGLFMKEEENKPNIEK